MDLLCARKEVVDSVFYLILRLECYYNLAEIPLVILLIVDNLLMSGGFNWQVQLSRVL